MIDLTEEQRRVLQLTELELLKEVHRICRKHRIHYNIIAGTLLGAVRHGGFIPWDDDADIAMLREEYDRFVLACRTELDPDRFCFQDHRCTEGYRWGYGKLRRKETLFLREHQEMMPYDQGVSIDIFPLDYVPDTRAGRTLKNLECFVLRKILWSRVGKEADENALKRAVYRVLDRIPEMAAKRLLDGLIERSRRKPSDWVRILMFPTPNRQYGYRKRWYAHSRKISFEDFGFLGIRDHDEYLRFKYGDYMTPPPAAERKKQNHPVTALILPDRKP